MLELLPHGRGQIFPDPAKLLFVKQDRGFREAIVAAQESVRELLDGDLQGYDVRWGLKSHGDQQFTELAKESAGGAFALGLTVLWPQSRDSKLFKRVRRLDVSRVAVTAKLKQEEGLWRFAHVDALSAKMWAAVQRPEQITTVYVAPGQPRDDFPSLRVAEASSLLELVDKLRKEPKPVDTPLVITGRPSIDLTSSPDVHRNLRMGLSRGSYAKLSAMSIIGATRRLSRCFPADTHLPRSPRSP
jgi:hypothetical protein